MVTSAAEPGLQSSRPVLCSDYSRVLRDSPHYRILLLAYCIDNIGNWLTFIACLKIIGGLGRALYTSLFLALRLLPSLLLGGKSVTSFTTISVEIELCVMSILYQLYVLVPSSFYLIWNGRTLKNIHLSN